MSVCPIGPDLLSHLVVRQGLGYCFLQSGRPALSSPPRLGCEAEGWTASPWAWTSLHILSQAIPTGATGATLGTELLFLFNFCQGLIHPGLASNLLYGHDFGH